MASMPDEIVVQVRLVNIKDVRCLVKAAVLAQEIAKDQPWNSDAPRIVRLLKQVVKGLTLKKAS